MSATKTLSVALDLGTTRIKAGLLGPDGRLERVASVEAPPLSGADPMREGDAGEYVGTAARLLAEVSAQVPRGMPLGIASQRSTFLLWERDRGKPVTPMISWLDRRAADWCDRHAASQEPVLRRTGLPLSPHYAGPKLATLLEARPDLRDRLRNGDLVFGNLDSFALCAWSAAPVHETDLTMAARTLLVDLARGDWCDELRNLFHVPRACLPALRPTAGRQVALVSGPVVTATISDQAAGALAVLGAERDAALVNLGTGGFVLRIVESVVEAPRGYLRAPVFWDGQERPVYALEGTINAVAAALDRLSPGPASLSAEDPTPDAFCLPDAAGVGSPYWLPRFPQTLSRAARALPPGETRRIVVEGIVFRVREILEDLSREAPPGRILLAGGLARDPLLGPALAACLGRSVEVAGNPEATLLGAATLAAGLAPSPAPASLTIAPRTGGAYLGRKFLDWKAWVRELLG